MLSSISCSCYTGLEVRVKKIHYDTRNSLAFPTQRTSLPPSTNSFLFCRRFFFFPLFTMAEVFSLSDCDVIGFDLDHTLCRYRLQETSRLIYYSFAQYLVAEKRYSEELLAVTPDNWDFCCKGLVLDLEDGYLLKLGEDGTVLRACHGTAFLTSEEIIDTFGKDREWTHFKTLNGTFSRSAKYYFYDNYFDLPASLVCAKIVDVLNQSRTQKKYCFWKDIIAAIEHNYKTSAFKGCVMRSVVEDFVIPKFKLKVFGTCCIVLCITKYGINKFYNG
nr:PREDICTED: 5'-nucleotidase domain-containing protein 1-like [Latimeria chalumnae]|eukprot:XP_014348155.1 PREDICTED: 5'-nucleotidase domain-containing protein 1-like [Latimeria chalumnae]